MVRTKPNQKQRLLIKIKKLMLEANIKKITIEIINDKLIITGEEYEDDDSADSDFDPSDPIED